MEQTYVTIHRVKGMMGLPDDTRHRLIEIPAAEASAFLTMDRSPYFLHLRRIAAFGRMSASIFVGPDASSGAADTRFERALAGCDIHEGSGADSPLLIVEASEEATVFHPERVVDVGDVGIGYDCLSTHDLAQRSATMLEAAAAGISLALSPSASPVMTELGHIAYASDQATGRLTYSVELSAASSNWSAVTPSNASLAAAASMATTLWANADLKTVSHLLSRSIRTTDDLQAFLTAWAGLEVLVAKAFKSSYEKEIYRTLSRAMPSKQFVERVQDVMKGKYNVADKFAVMCAFLDLANSETDIECFRNLKRVRDGIHEMKINASGYPTQAVQQLLMKYFRLHLTAMGRRG